VIAGLLGSGGGGGEPAPPAVQSDKGGPEPPSRKRKAPARHLRGRHGEEQWDIAELFNKQRRHCRRCALPRPAEGSMK